MAITKDELAAENAELKARLEAMESKLSQATPTNAVALTVAERQTIDLKTEGYEGKYRNLRGEDPDEVYGLKKLPVSDQFDNTHELKSQLHTWRGTEAQFRTQFERR